MVLARWGAAALFLIALPLLLLLSNVRIAAGEPAVFGYSFDRYDAVETTGVARPELDRAARDDDRELLDIRVAIDGREQALFNPREVLHMRDVKDLFGSIFRLHELALVYVVGYIAAVFLWARERSMRHLARLVALGGGITVGTLVLASGGVLIGFDDLFRQFHVLSFSNDFWQLDPDRDRLIQMFPRGFWFDATLGVGLLTMLEAALLSAVGLAYLARARARARERPARPGGGALPPPPTPLNAPASASEKS
jgi:integral membrane protein (TIGR01906 family)